MNGVRAPVRLAMVVVMMVCLAQDGVAQRRSGPPQGADRAELERRVRARFAEIMRERLELSEEAAAELGRTLRSFEDERRALRREEEGLRGQVAAFMEGGVRDDARARDLIRTMMELRQREVELFSREQDALLQVLTPSQVLRFHGVREELNQRVRRLRGGPPRTGDGRRRPGGNQRSDDSHAHDDRNPRSVLRLLS